MSQPKATARATILIVDDEPAIRSMLSQGLRTLGGEWRVETVGNGLEALRLLEQLAVDVLVTDIYMPEMEGIEIIRRVRESHPDVPIVAMSGAGGAGSGDCLEIAQLVGAQSILRKPFTAQSLVDVLTEVLPQDA
jgi:CheY-like chemotaxis protein